jgi:hypothetical protein
MDGGTTNAGQGPQAQRIGCMGMLLLLVAGVAAFAAVLVPLILVSNTLGLSQGAFPRIALVDGVVSTGVAVTVIMRMARRLRRPITYS